MGVWLMVAVLIALIMGLPYSLYLDSQKIEQPVVVFEAHSWRAALWSFSMLVFAGAILALACVMIMKPRGLLSELAALALGFFGAGVGFIILRLHFSYWQHDRHATLTVFRQEQRVEYHNKGLCLRVALADVVQITTYTTYGSRGPAWGNYSYQVLVLQDGSQLLLTCLLYSMLGPQDIMPTPQRHTERRYICWLPGDKLSSATLF